MIDFLKYNNRTDYEIPVNPANIIDFRDDIKDNNNTRSIHYNMQADAYLECADELTKWLYDNNDSANPFDFGVILYLLNHSVELKLKAFLIKIGITKSISSTHNCIELAKKIPEKYLSPKIYPIYGSGEMDTIAISKKQTLIDSIANLTSQENYNTSGNELGRFIDNRDGERLARNENGEVVAPLMTTVYNYHNLIDFLNERYGHINENRQP